MRLVLVLGDQLSRDLSALRAADMATDAVVMAEVADETDYAAHHPKKIAFIFAAMRRFAQDLRNDGWTVHYTRLDDAENTGSITGEILRQLAETGAQSVLATEPGEWRLIDALQDPPLPVELLEDDRFLCSHDRFAAWAKGRKQLRLGYFYREMRRETGLLMDGDQPAEGKWNFDHDNRKPAPDAVDHVPLWFEPHPTTAEVLELVAARFGNRFGDLHPFGFATCRADALQVLAHFVENALPRFGDFQDAMLRDQPFLYHSLLSPYLNCGLLTPLEVCRAAEKAYEAGHAPINAVEGFIRQIIGWREYVRGIYFHEGRDYTARNALGHSRALPAFYWGAPTQMACVSAAVGQTREHAYAHHIQRLMVTGNFALLAGIDPTELHEWYLAVYIDAFEWVEAPNTVGMSQFADDGVIASKPYVSSGAYINRMSDYCKSCRYRVADKLGPNACPFNLLYWHFLIRHRDRFAANPRMANMYRTWDWMDEDRKSEVIRQADSFLKRLDEREIV